MIRKKKINNCSICDNYIIEIYYTDNPAGGFLGNHYRIDWCDIKDRRIKKLIKCKYFKKKKNGKITVQRYME